jgi:hypothetical protein
MAAKECYRMSSRKLKMGVPGHSETNPRSDLGFPRFFRRFYC